ncbi:MAG: ABC transporter permease subunit [Verrucomicrobiales bacterium]|nr:ABC transporter permease subunit [Verrucomicrobiales bacterium]
MPLTKTEQVPSQPLAPQDLEAGRSLWKDAWYRLLKNKLAITCLVIFAVIVGLCIFGPVVSSTDDTAQNLELGAQGPSAEHWMGTDTLGRDQMVRILKGGRVSLAVGLVATLVSIIIGVSYGAAAAYIGGRVDAAMMRFVDILYALPFIVFVVLLTVVLDPFLDTPEKKMILLFAAIGAVEWLTMARIVRAQVLSLKKQEFIEAAHALGLSTPRIIFRHLVPNVLGPVIVYGTLTVPAIMLFEAVLSFIGLGTQPPAASWGVLIQEGANNMETAPWMLLYPSIFFAAALFSLNAVGDGLRDALDVRSSKD